MHVSGVASRFRTAALETRKVMDLDVNAYLGRQLRRRRRLLGLTQKHIAVVVGVGFQQIQKYECGANRMSAAMLWKLAGALDAPVEYFFEGFSRADARKVAE